MTTFQGGSLAGGGIPDADLLIDVVDVDGSGRPLELLSSSVVAESTIDFAKFVGIALPEEAKALAAWRARIKQRPSCRA